jgi:hypothetical protein
MSRCALIVAFVLGLSMAVPAVAAAADRDDVLKVVTEAYINGVHIKRDAAAMRAGFHPDFRMLVLGADGKMTHVTLADWAGRIEKAAADPKSPKPPAIKYEFPQVDIQGTAAVVRVEIWRDGVYTFTDYLSLYKFPDGWKIVGKIYYTHPKQQ